MNEMMMKYSRYTRSYAARNAKGDSSSIAVSPSSRARGSSNMRVKRTRYRNKMHPRKKRRIACVVITLAVIAIAATCLVVCNANERSFHDFDFSSKLPSQTPTSTPEQEWRKGSTPCLYQTDKQWATVPYGNDTLAESGCGPTCLSMVYVRLTGKKDMDPKKMCEYSTKGGFLENGLTRWTFMSEGAAGIGLRATELPADKSKVKEALLSGKPIIASMGPGDFTSNGHFIVICGVDSNGNAVIRDPNSEQNTSRAWDFDRLLGQARNLWAYSVR